MRGKRKEEENICIYFVLSMVRYRWVAKEWVKNDVRENSVKLAMVYGYRFASLSKVEYVGDEQDCSKMGMRYIL